MNYKKFQVWLKNRLDGTKPNLNDTLFAGDMVVFRYAPTERENVIDTLIIYTGNIGKNYIEGISLFEMPSDIRYQLGIKLLEDYDNGLRILKKMFDTPSVKRQYLKKYLIRRIDKTGIRKLNKNEKKVILSK